MPQFMNETDMSLTRMGSEIMFQSQVIEAQKKQIAELMTEKANLEKKLNGYERDGQDAPEEQRRSESESVSRQRGNIDDRSRPHINGGTAKSKTRHDTF